MAGGGGGQIGAQLKPELRLKIYNQAIGHYETAKALHEEGRKEEALEELQKAVKTIRAFPEAYELAHTIYVEMGDEKRAQEQEKLFEFYGGRKGASLYRLREEVSRLAKRRIKLAPPPDVDKKSAFRVLGVFMGILFLGMFYDLYRMWLGAKDRKTKILLGNFPGDEFHEDRVSWIFKLCALLMPAPVILLLLLSLGVKYYSDILPIFTFSWLVADIAVYLIFFADFSDFGSGGGGGFRGRGPGGGFR